MNHVQGEIKLFLETLTTLRVKEFMRKFNNVVSAKLQLVTSDGEVHSVDFVDVMNLNWFNFEEDESLDVMTSDSIAKTVSCVDTVKKITA